MTHIQKLYLIKHAELATVNPATPDELEDDSFKPLDYEQNAKTLEPLSKLTTNKIVSLQNQGRDDASIGTSFSGLARQFNNSILAGPRLPKMKSVPSIVSTQR